MEVCRSRCALDSHSRLQFQVGPARCARSVRPRQDLRNDIRWKRVARLSEWRSEARGYRYCGDGAWALKVKWRIESPMRTLRLMVVAVALLNTSVLSAQVRVWQGTLTLPTYEEGLPDPNPPFDQFTS